jgi:hypothetical protein
VSINNQIKFNLFGLNKNSKPDWLRCKAGMLMLVGHLKLKALFINLILGLTQPIILLSKNNSFNL